MEKKTLLEIRASEPLRNRLLGLGLVPGMRVSIHKSHRWPRLMVIQVGFGLIGLREEEWRALVWEDS